MAINLDIFCSFIKNWVLDDMDDSLTFEIEESGKRGRNNEARNKTHKPSQLSDNTSHRSIFHLD